MNKRNKTILIVLLLVSLIVINCNVAMAGILDKAQHAKDEVVNFIQEIALIAAVVFISWAGIIFWGAGGDHQKIAAAKQKLLFFCIALFLIFDAEDIVQTISNWFK